MLQAWMSETGKTFISFKVTGPFMNLSEKKKPAVLPVGFYCLKNVRQRLKTGALGNLRIAIIAAGGTKSRGPAEGSRTRCVIIRRCVDVIA